MIASTKEINVFVWMGYLFLSVAFFPLLASAEVFFSQDEAFRLAFPEKVSMHQRSYVLTDEQQEKVQQLARVKLDSSMYTLYEGVSQGKVIGYAAIDARVIRSATATFLVVLSPQAHVQKVVVLAFHEPPDYLPSPEWLANFNKPMELAEMVPRNGIPPIAGSTLSVEGISSGVRVATAMVKVLTQQGAP